MICASEKVITPRSGDDGRDGFDGAPDVVHEGGDHPGPRDREHDHGGDELGHEGERGLLDLGDGLEDADEQPDHHDRAEHRHGHHQQQRERVAPHRQDHLGGHGNSFSLASGHEAGGQGAEQQVPSVRQHEQHQLERQRHQHRGQHHHAQ